MGGILYWKVVLEIHPCNWSHTNGSNDIDLGIDF